MESGRARRNYLGGTWLILGAPMSLGTPWLLLAPLGSYWLPPVSPGSAWLLLAAPDSSWLLLAPPGSPCSSLMPWGLWGEGPAGEGNRD